MKKDIKVGPAIFPMPVLMIGTYNEDGSVDVMNAAWGSQYDFDKIKLNLTSTHMTVKNIKRNGEFTVALADASHVIEADYFGLVSANNTSFKFEKSGLTATPSEKINAPIIEEFPVVMECQFIIEEDDGIVGKIVGLKVDDKYIEDGKVNVENMHILAYDTFNHGYYEVGKKVGQAYSDGKKLMR
jgi:flavin reductase (DIM6/NTAB) family NADH-FMN oxidoreductase RutF